MDKIAADVAPTNRGVPERRKPEWRVWRQLALLDWDEAVALSADLDPSLFRRSFKPDDYPDYWERHGIALRHLRSGTFPTFSKESGRKHECSWAGFATWALSLGWTLPDEFPRPPEKGEAAAPERGWPWGKHETALLRKLAAAAAHWWEGKYEPGRPATAPTNDEVSDWLVQQGVSRRVADIMAQILRADSVPQGPHVNR